MLYIYGSDPRVCMYVGGLKVETLGYYVGDVSLYRQKNNEVKESPTRCMYIHVIFHNL